MRLQGSLLSVLAVLASQAHAAPASDPEPETAAAPALGPDANGKYWLNSTELKMAFIPYGASIANLLIADKNGIWRDIVTGFDTALEFATDTKHAHFGGVVGRYANRIKNSTFTIDGTEYHVLPNDNPTESSPEGLDTLHGGPNGWDWRDFTVEAYTGTTITFGLVDPAGEQGFPGEVRSLITYTVDGADWNFEMVAVPTTEKTPIMLSSHTYWNLDGFANDETDLALDHIFHLPYGKRRVGVDGILIPTGELPENEEGGVNDFWSKPRAVGAAFDDPDLVGNCGAGCTGYDNCYLTDRDHLGQYDWRTEGPVASMSSPWSGIRVDIFSDQDAFQLYSCNFQDGTTPLKSTQGRRDDPDAPTTIQKYGCFVMEVEEWIDGINHPEWGRMDKQIFGPGDGNPYVLKASYRFSVEE